MFATTAQSLFDTAAEARYGIEIADRGLDTLGGRLHSDRTLLLRVGLQHGVSPLVAMAGLPSGGWFLDFEHSGTGRPTSFPS